MFKIFLSTLLFNIFFFFTKQESLPKVRASDEEIIDLVRTFYEIDNNAAAGDDILLDYQGHTNLQSIDDKAPSPLFKKVSPFVEKRPTFRAFLALMDNYIPEVGVQEKNTKEEKREIDYFLATIMNTTIGKEFFIFLTKKNHPYAKNRNYLIENLKQLWFGSYSRYRGVLDSSGFEHVFMGEIKNGEVSGLHNWYRFYKLESDGIRNQFDYKGFIVKRFNTMASVKFSWKGYYKKGGSLFISSSPEFDFFVYTICFLFRTGSKGCNIEINGCPASITAYELYQNNKLFIGSLFPNIGAMTEECKIYNAGLRK